MSDIKRIHPATRMSRAVVYNGTVSIGGQTADDRSQDVAGQTRQVLAKIDGYLAEAGIDKTRLLTAQIWLRDIESDFASMNSVWDAWVAPDCAPTRATVEAKLAAPDLRVEISVTAAA
jgi:enamine deaminase RidA (YjgF/YER057c/UK114 family)